MCASQDNENLFPVRVCVYEYGRACIYVFIGDFRDFPLLRVLAHNMREKNTV